MIKQTLDYIRTNVIKKRIIKPKDKAESITFFNYPYQAIEEAVVNALYHRDYQEREPVEITIEPKKISILSYAGPDRSISLDAIHKAEHLKSRRYRNRRLGDYLKELQLSEGRATGIPTIQDELRKNGSGQAKIETDEAINKNALSVLLEISRSPHIKRKALLGLIDISKATLERIIKQLSSEPLRLIEYQGSLKTGGYVLTEKGQEYLETLR